MSFDDPFETMLNNQCGSCLILNAPVCYTEAAIGFKNGEHKKLSEKQYVFDVHCFKFRFGVAFINTDSTFSTVNVSFVKKGKKVKSFTFKMVGKTLRWYTWSRSKVRTTESPLFELHHFTTRCMGLWNDYEDERVRLENALAFALFRMAYNHMPWVLNFKPRTFDQCDLYNPLTDCHTLFRKMLFPNIRVKHAYALPHVKMFTTQYKAYRGTATEICNYVVGNAGKRAKQLLASEHLFFYPYLKNFMSVDAFLNYDWSPFDPDVTRLPPKPADLEEGVQLNLEKLIVKSLSELTTKEYSHGVPAGGCGIDYVAMMLKDITANVNRLHGLGVRPKDFRKLKKNCKDLAQFDAALGSAGSLLQTTHFDYVHVYKAPIDKYTKALLTVRTPSSSLELYTWGKQLGNCIASYANYYASGCSLLLGVVDASGQCLAAAEIRRDSVNQNFYSHPRVLIKGEHWIVYLVQCEGRPLYVEALTRHINSITHGALTENGIKRVYQFGEPVECVRTEINASNIPDVIAKVCNIIKQRNNAETY